MDERKVAVDGNWRNLINVETRWKDTHVDHRPVCYQGDDNGGCEKKL